MINTKVRLNLQEILESTSTEEGTIGLEEFAQSFDEGYFRGMYGYNGGIDCDMIYRHCSCGASHYNGDYDTLKIILPQEIKIFSSIGHSSPPDVPGEPSVRGIEKLGLKESIRDYEGLLISNSLYRVVHMRARNSNGQKYGPKTLELYAIPQELIKETKSSAGFIVHNLNILL